MGSSKNVSIISVTEGPPSFLPAWENALNASLRQRETARTSARQMPSTGAITQGCRKQERPSASACASLKGLTERRDVCLAALQPPCAPLGLRASSRPPSYAAALEGIVSGWPHYFPLNQPKEGLSQAQWSWLQRGMAVTHLQHSALALNATILTLLH